MTDRAKLTNANDAKTFLLGGNATFTLVSTKTGTRFTYKVTAHRDNDGTNDRWFVKVLQGPNNEADFGYLGTIFNGNRYYHGKKSHIGKNASSAVAFEWAFRKLSNGSLPDALEFWHEGSCCMCGRKLTVPSSVATGIGPICAVKLAA